MDSHWRNRAEFITAAPRSSRFSTASGTANSTIASSRRSGRSASNRIAVRFAYEWHDDCGNWFRSYGNENWEFDERRPDAPAHRQHQRSADRRDRPQISLAARPPSRRSSRAERTRALGDATNVVRTESPQSRTKAAIAVCATALVVLAVVVAAHRGNSVPADGRADIILSNGHIVHTPDPAQPWAEAIAIRGNKIVAVGTNAQVLALRGPRAQSFDLGGRMAMPGIIDTHTHFVEGSEILAGVSVAGLASVDAVKAHLLEFAKTHPGDTWIYGGGWDYGSFWPGGLPTKEILDGIFPSRPVLLVSSDGHSVWANSAALARAKITRSTPNPNTPELHGIIVRDPKTGEPTGVLEEGAPISSSLQRSMIRRCSRTCAAAWQRRTTRESPASSMRRATATNSACIRHVARSR